MSSTSTAKQYQTRRRINTNTTHQSRNMNAYIDRDDYHQQSLMNKNHYWNQDYHRSNDNFYPSHYYQYRNAYPSSSQHMRKERQTKSEQQYHSKSLNNNYTSYYDNVPPRHRHEKREQRSSHAEETDVVNNKSEPMKLSNSAINDEQLTKPLHSASSTTTNSENTTNISSAHRKDLHTKNLAAAAMAARQQNAQPQTNLNAIQTLMNSLILQQQQQPTQTQSTIQLQYQLTNALLATMIQQRVKESVLQAQAQQIQAALPTLLAAQALIYQQHQQQQGQITPNPQQTQPVLPSHITHPGTKFNNCPLVKFPTVRPTNPSLSSGVHIPQPCSTTILPTYQQIQEIERGISLDQAIHLKSAIDITNVNNNFTSNESTSTE
ncbi:unnamed protein product [Adineta ricciae]|uniref:Uncharacterized protein n=1 Tax=Adineta ricciae TaxID=249248 RepID=A0A814AXR0_ADIRI|nr:unnamed protein product [Adineta ricciae]